MQNLAKPEAGLKHARKLAQTQGAYHYETSEAVSNPIQDSGEGPIAHPQRINKTSQQVYQSAESFGHKKKFANRQQIKEDFLDDDLANESGEIDPSLFIM